MFILSCVILLVLFHFLNILFTTNSVPKRTRPNKKLSVDDENNFLPPKRATLKKAKTTMHKRGKASGNHVTFALSSPNCSPIPSKSAELSRSPASEFSPGAINTIFKEAEDSFQKLSVLRKTTMSMDHLLQSIKMEKYSEIFRKKHIDNLASFSLLTEQDLIKIGISKKKDRKIILDIMCADSP